MISPIGRTFEPYAMGALTLIGFAGAALAAMVSTIRKEKPTQGIARVIESFVLAWSGGAIARLFISYLLAWGHDSQAARLFVGWTFFFWPGVIDTIPTAYDSPLFDANAYLLMAT